MITEYMIEHEFRRFKEQSETDSRNFLISVKSFAHFVNLIITLEILWISKDILIFMLFLKYSKVRLYIIDSYTVQHMSQNL